jgi:hypothetical protein
MRWSPVRVVAESEPIHQTSRMLAQRASRAWPATHQFEKLARRELLGAENFHLDTKVPDDDDEKRHSRTGSNSVARTNRPDDDAASNHDALTQSDRLTQNRNDAL